MKIGDIKIGTEYVIGEGKGRSHYGDLPRRATALEIVTVEEEYWTGGSWAQSRAKRNVRRVKVRFENEPTRQNDWRSLNASVPKGEERIIAARFIEAEWANVRKDVEARIAAKEAEEKARVEYEARVKALLPKRLHDDFHVSTWHGRYGKKPNEVVASIDLRGELLDIILGLAEDGYGLEGKS